MEQIFLLNMQCLDRGYGEKLILEILNQSIKNTKEPSIVGKPNRVFLDHLYCSAMKHGLMVLGTTSRYKKKYVTTVYYNTASLEDKD